MRKAIPLVLSLSFLIALGGCSSKKKRYFAASTVGATTSSNTSPTTTNTTPAPITTTVTPVTPTTPTNPVPTPTLQTDAMVASWNLKEVIHVDSSGGQILNRWATGDGPSDVTHSLTETFVSNAVSQDITVIDRLAGSVSQTIDVTSTPATGLGFLGFLDQYLNPLVRPTGLAITPDKRKIFSANLLNVTAIDAQTLMPTKSMLGLNSLSLQNLITNPGQAFQNFISAPVRGLGMAKIAATNDYALATCLITGTVMRIDARTDSVVGYTDVGRAPIGIAVANGKAYVACALSQEVWVVDVATGNHVTTLAAGMIPVDVAASPSQDKVYVANAVSGDITVIDTSSDSVVDTLPAGLSIVSIFQQAGVTVPTGANGGINGLLNGFLQGFASGLSNPQSFGSLLTGQQGGLLNPGNLINGLLTGFLGYPGINQSQLANMNLPALGIMSLSVAHDPNLIMCGNAFLGELAITEASTRNVTSITGLSGLGPVDVKAIWPL